MKREGIIPPKFADKFFRIDFETEPLPVLCLYPIPPSITLDEVRIEVVGLEQHPRVIPWSILSTLPRVTLEVPLVCQLFNWYEPVVWEGIRLVDLLDYLRVDTHAEGYFGIYSRDSVYFETLSRDEIRDPRVLLAYGINGKPLPEENGGPIRLVVPFLQGYKSVKWVGAIRAFRNDPVGIKRLLGQSPSGRLNDAWRERLGIVPPEGRAGDPPPFGASPAVSSPASSRTMEPSAEPGRPVDPASAPAGVLEPIDQNTIEGSVPEQMVMCEVIAIVRPEKRQATQKSLEEAGIHAYSTFGALGRGRQKGLRFKGEDSSEAAIRFLPRQVFILIVPESQLEKAVSAIMKANNSGKGGHFGDGKIFVMKTDEAIRISSGETGEEAI